CSFRLFSPQFPPCKSSFSLLKSDLQDKAETMKNKKTRTRFRESLHTIMNFLLMIAVCQHAEMRAYTLVRHCKDKEDNLKNK
ncbi:MAG: hypothetical protein RSB29_02470, partial [Alistipes sp.]